MCQTIIQVVIVTFFQFRDPIFMQIIYFVGMIATGQTGKVRADTLKMMIIASLLLPLPLREIAT